MKKLLFVFFSLFLTLSYGQTEGAETSKDGGPSAGRAGLPPRGGSYDTTTVARAHVVSCPGILVTTRSQPAGS